MNKLLSVAIDLAQFAHHGQVDKAGQPYILHVQAVADGVDTDELKTIAYLHDVCEDTPFGIDDLTELEFPDEIVQSVRILTRAKGTPYMEYIQAVKQDDNARQVKVSDLKHNMDLSRIPEPTDADYKRVEKYRKALDYLITD